MDFANLILNVDVAYEADIEKVKKIINQAGLELSRQAQFKQQIIKSPTICTNQRFRSSRSHYSKLWVRLNLVVSGNLLVKCV